MLFTHLFHQLNDFLHSLTILFFDVLYTIVVKNIRSIPYSNFPTKSIRMAKFSINYLRVLE